MNQNYEKKKPNLVLGTKPNFLILGAQKAGTYGLFYTLKQHSLLSKSTHKEIHYFDNDVWYKQNNIKEYQKYFCETANERDNTLFFEATPDYLFHPKAAERIYEFNPKMKLIILLRNPIERALSAWIMFHHQADKILENNIYDPRSFSEAIEEELEKFETSNFYNDFRAYIKRGIYESQIRAYLKYFPFEQMLIIESEQLRTQHEFTMNQIFAFLNIPDEDIGQLILNQRVVGETNKYSKILQLLEEFYKPHNEKLFTLLGLKFAW
jgi:hypothetical protein